MPGLQKYHQLDSACRYGQSKWTVLKNFPRGDYLYNHASARASESPFVLLLEGPCDVFRAAEAGVAAVAAFGSDLSPVQAHKLAALRKNVVIAFDNDEAGGSGAAKAAHLLRGGDVRTKRASPPEQFHDVGEMTIDDIEKWLKVLNEEDAEEVGILGGDSFFST